MHLFVWHPLLVYRGGICFENLSTYSMTQCRSTMYLISKSTRAVNIYDLKHVHLVGGMPTPIKVVYVTPVFCAEDGKTRFRFLFRLIVFIRLKLESREVIRDLSTSAIFKSRALKLVVNGKIGPPD